MSVVDVTEVSASFFVFAVIFILLVFGLLSLGILKMFQQRFRAGWFSFGGAVAGAIVFVIMLNMWYI